MYYVMQVDQYVLIMNGKLSYSYRMETLIDLNLYFLIDNTY